MSFLTMNTAVRRLLILCPGKIIVKKNLKGQLANVPTQYIWYFLSSMCYICLKTSSKNLAWGRWSKDQYHLFGFTAFFTTSFSDSYFPFWKWSVSLVVNINWPLCCLQMCFNFGKYYYDFHFSVFGWLVGCFFFLWGGGFVCLFINQVNAPFLNFFS